MWCEQDRALVPPGPFQAGIIGMEKLLTQRRPRSQHTAWSWSHPAAPRSAGSPGSSPRAAARLAKEKDGVGSSLSQGDAPETLLGLQIPPGTRAGGFSVGSISTCRMQSGSYRLKANTRNELMGRNLHPRSRKNMEGQQTAKNLLEAMRLSCLCFEL